MEMRFFWISDKCAQQMYALHWHPGQENLADYQSKHHTGAHHMKVRPWYLHEANSPKELPRALRPSALKGCVGTLDGGYNHKVPLPRAPRLQRAALAEKCTATFFPFKMYGYILESRVVGEPIVACGNGFQFPSSSSGRTRSLRKQISISVVK